MMSLSVEEFSSWFRSKEASYRLEIMTAALQMLHPLELRFIASCVEELTRKDYYCFRECEMRYNGGNFDGDLLDLSDIRCRGKLLVALSLLYSENYTVASSLFKTLLSLYSIFENLPKTKEVADEVLLLLNMAKFHPAFKFEQRAIIGEMAEAISQRCKYLPSCGSGSCSSDNAMLSSEENGPVPDSCDHSQNISDSAIAAGQSKDDNMVKLLVDCSSQTEDDNSTEQPMSASQSGLVQESTINQSVDLNQSCLTCFAECIAALPPSANAATSTVVDIVPMEVVETSSRNCIYGLKVLWSNGNETMVTKSFKDWHNFHKELLNLHPLDAGGMISDRTLPYFPGYLGGIREESEDASLAQLDTYIRELKLLPNIFQSACLINFLTTPSNSTALVNGWSAGLAFTDPNDLSLLSEDIDIGLDHAGMNQHCYVDSEPELSHKSPHLCNGSSEVQEPAQTDVSPLKEELHESTSAIHQENLRKNSIVLSYAKDIDQGFLPSSSVRGSFDGFHQGLAATLLIVRPSSASPALEKILQSSLLSQDNPPKILAADIGVGMESHSKSVTSARVPGDEMQ